MYILLTCLDVCSGYLAVVRCSRALLVCTPLVCIDAVLLRVIRLSIVHWVQVLVCQLLMDGMKAYNCLLPLVTALPRQGPPFPASESAATWRLCFRGMLMGVMRWGYALWGVPCRGKIVCMPERVYALGGVYAKGSAWGVCLGCLGGMP